ncbi:Protein TIC110, chloroplastic [Dendrobium catenatum]|uniref:Protein TIC110, chloroplastic n=2 Tax=Dendrobium catenatum TaxID=906689 RepID=A0A2I0VPQ7_9ASPA|nr:Protein TIC110, chloroplastic [Dendrobium catenatum]
MDFSLVLPTSSSPSRHLIFSPFKHTPIRVQSLKAPRTSLRCRFRLSAAAEVEETVSFGKPSVFGLPKDLTAPQKIVDTLPPRARLASYVVFTGAALAAGFGLGFRFGGSQATGIGGAAVLGVAAGAAVYSINSGVPEVAALNLHNLVTGYDDPTELKKENVEAIVEKYGVSRQDEAFREELRDLYSRFVSSVIPPGAENLKGNEVEAIIKFKNALGIDDPDAASVHMEIGRHIFRQRLETGDREANAEQRRAFQKLVYVSTLVFGEASKFLLPWKRIFKVTDAQVDIAIRDNAQRLFAVKLNSVGRG